MELAEDGYLLMEVRASKPARKVVEVLKVLKALSPPSTTSPTTPCSPYDGSARFSKSEGGYFLVEVRASEFPAASGGAGFDAMEVRARRGRERRERGTTCYEPFELDAVLMSGFRVYTTDAFFVQNRKFAVEGSILEAPRVRPVSIVILAREWTITDWKQCHGSHGFHMRVPLNYFLDPICDPPAKERCR